MDEPRRMNWTSLLATRNRLRANRENTTAQDIEIQRRLAVPFGCVLLPLIGVPLGVQRSRAVRSRGIVVGLSVVLIYYFLVTIGVTLVHQHMLGAIPALWGPNIALALAGLIAFRNASGEGLGRSRRPSR
jgi:lipopolysaccharide export LptBFGC system permease protein LptF